MIGALCIPGFLKGLDSGSAVYWQPPMLQVGLQGAIFTHSSPLFACGYSTNWASRGLHCLVSLQKAHFEDRALGGGGLPRPLYSGRGNPSSSLNPTFLKDLGAAVTAATPLSPSRLLARSLKPACVSRRGVIAVLL